MREWVIDAKYNRQLFAKETIKKGIVHDLSKSWFFLDEVTRETTRVRGPYSRIAIKYLLDEGKVIFSDGFVWHPSLGNKWMLIDKVYEIISPPPNLSDQALQDACMKKLSLQSHPHPHLKGHLNLIYRGNCTKKWIIILDRKIGIYSNSLSQVPEMVIQIEDITDILLTLNDNFLGIKIEEGLTCYILFTKKVDEVME